MVVPTAVSALLAPAPSEVTRLDQVLQRPVGLGQLGFGESVRGHLGDAVPI